MLQGMNIATKHLNELISNHTQNMKGKVVAITGTTSGTGYVCARELAKLGAEVLLLNRDSERSERAFAQLKEEVPQGKLVRISCDLQDFESVRKAATTIIESYKQLDVLCNNAGVMALPDRATKDGYCVQMQTNCISHFLLTKELFPLLQKSPEGRIVNHTSMARLGPPLDGAYFEKRGGDLGGDGTDTENSSFSGPRWARYHQTKLANCAFTYSLKEKFEARGFKNLKALLAHPGLAATQLQVTTSDEGGMSLEGEFMKQAQSAEDGALGIIRCCADPNAQSGDFFGPEGWTGYPNALEPEPQLFAAETLRINWEGCSAAVGSFDI